MAGLGLGSLKNLFSLSSGSSFVGLSIGSSSVKLVELQRSGKVLKLVHYARANLSEGAIENHEIINQVAVIENLKNLTTQIKLSSKAACCGVSGEGVAIKYLSLEVQNPKELQEQVFFESEQYLPFEISDVYLDYCTLNNAKQGRVDVLVVAARRALVDGRISVLEGAGLKAKVIDTDFFALGHAYEHNYPTQGQAVALVDVGASSIKLSVVFNGVPLFTKESPMGGRTLTQEIQQRLGLSFQDAETLKISTKPQEIPQEVSELMATCSENFSDEVRRGIDLYNSSAVGARVGMVLLAGGASRMPGFSRAIEEKIGAPCQYLNPFNSIAYDTNIFTPDYIGEIGPTAAVAAGLALRMAGK